MDGVRRRLSEVSERRACKVIKQPRSTHRYRPKRCDFEDRLVKRLHELARERPRFGTPRVTELLRREGWNVNEKRIARLRRREGLKVPVKQHKRRRLGSTSQGILHRRAEHIDHVWSYDFISDQTEDGRRLKILPIVDEFTRECLTLEVGRHFTSLDLIEVLDYLIEVRGAPRYIRSDNGPEFIAAAVRTWLADSGVRTLFIEPGSPWENAYVESFNSRLRDELLDRELFVSLGEARVVLEDHRLDYNHRRPHSSLGYLTPATFAARCRETVSASAPIGACAPSASRHINPHQTLIGAGT